MKKLLVGLCTVGLLASSLVHAVEYEWTNKQGMTEGAWGVATWAFIEKNTQRGVKQ